MDPQFAGVEEQYNSHPAIQAFLRSGSRHPLEWMRAVATASRDLGINMPHDYQPAVRGGRVALEKKSFIDRNGWFLPAVAVGAPIAAGAALGAFGGAGAAGAAGGAAGAGGAGTAVSTAATAAGAGGGLFGALKNLAPLASAIPLAASLFGGGDNDRGTSAKDLMESIPELGELMKLKMGQAQRQDPLHKAVTQMGINLMPRSGLKTYPGRPEIE